MIFVWNVPSKIFIKGNFLPNFALYYIETENKNV